MSERFNTAYRMISKYWRGQTDSKGTPYMLHIDHGITYLQNIRADVDTLAAWCLHPMVQSYSDMAKNLNMISVQPHMTKALALAIEYRNQANRYSTHKEFSTKISKLEHILPEVADMLRADKLQNYWHLTRNRQDHPNYEELEQYFNVWLYTLQVSQETVDDFHATFDIEV